MISVEEDFHIEETDPKAHYLLISDALIRLLGSRLPSCISKEFSLHFTFVFFKGLNLIFFLFYEFLNL
jgi:hypothetical protein